MQSGVHEIYTTEAAEAMKVFCDINGDGGWIVSMPVDFGKRLFFSQETSVQVLEFAET